MKKFLLPILTAALLLYLFIEYFIYGYFKMNSSESGLRFVEVTSNRSNANFLMEITNQSSSEETLKRNETLPMTEQFMNYALSETSKFLRLDDGLKDWNVNLSILNYGSSSQFQNMIKQALERKHLTIRLIGGSNSRRTEKVGTFFQHFYQWLDVTLAKPFGITLEGSNEGIGGTNSLYAVTCHMQRVNVSRTDLLLVEYAVNDAVNGMSVDGFIPLGRPMEELVRTAKTMNPDIFIVLVNLPVPWRLFHQGALNCQFIDEDDYLAIARQYDIGSVSWKKFLCDNATHQSGLSNATAVALTNRKYAEDTVHWLYNVHRHVSFLLMNYFTNMVQSLPFSEQTSQKALPKPVFNTTWFDGVPICNDTYNYELSITKINLTLSNLNLTGVGQFLPVFHVGYFTCRWSYCKAPAHYQMALNFKFLNTKSQEITTHRRNLNFTCTITWFNHYVVQEVYWRGQKPDGNYQSLYEIADFEQMVGEPLNRLFCTGDKEDNIMLTSVEAAIDLGGDHYQLRMPSLSVTMDRCRRSENVVIFD